MELRKRFFPLVVALISWHAHAAQAADPNAIIHKIAPEAARAAMLDPSVQTIRDTDSDYNYELLVKYTNQVDFEPESRRLLTEFVHRLLANHLDPAGKKAIDVCGEQIGLSTITGKPATRSLGCLHYNRYTENVTFDPDE